MYLRNLRRFVLCSLLVSKWDLSLLDVFGLADGSNKEIVSLTFAVVHVFFGHCQGVAQKYVTFAEWHKPQSLHI